MIHLSDVNYVRTIIIKLANEEISQIPHEVSKALIQICQIEPLCPR